MPGFKTRRMRGGTRARGEWREVQAAQHHPALVADPRSLGGRGHEVREITTVFWYDGPAITVKMGEWAVTTEGPAIIPEEEFRGIDGGLEEEGEVGLDEQQERGQSMLPRAGVSQDEPGRVPSTEPAPSHASGASQPAPPESPPGTSRGREEPGTATPAPSPAVTVPSLGQRSEPSGAGKGGTSEEEHPGGGRAGPGDQHHRGGAQEDDVGDRLRPVHPHHLDQGLPRMPEVPRLTNVTVRIVSEAFHYLLYCILLIIYLIVLLYRSPPSWSREVEATWGLSRCWHA